MNTANCCCCLNIDEQTAGITRPFWLCDEHAHNVLELIERLKKRPNPSGTAT